MGTEKDENILIFFKCGRLLRQHVFLAFATGLGCILYLLDGLQANAAEIGYTGRLTEVSGRPLEGPLDVSVRFYTAFLDGNLVGPTLSFPATELVDGVFQLNLVLDNSHVSQVFGDGTKPVWVEVEARGQTYPRQKLLAVPLALRVPIDSAQLQYSQDGKLGIDQIEISQVNGLNTALSSKVEASSLSNPGVISGSVISSGTIGGSAGISSTGNIATSGNINVRGTGSAPSELRFNSSDNSKYVGIKAPSSIASSVTWTLPGTDGAQGEVLATNGSGTLSWVSKSGSALVTLTDAPSIAVDASLGSMFQVTLGGNRTLAAPTHQTAGTTYIFKFVQDSTGSRTLTFDPAFVFPVLFSSAPLSTAPGSVDIGQFVSDGTSMYYLSGWLNYGLVSMPPGLLSATGDSVSSVALSWVDTNSGEIGYRIQRSLDNTTWETLTTSDPNETFYSDYNLSEGTHYFYRVITLRSGGNSIPAHADTWTFLHGPTSLVAVVKSISEIILTWVDNTTLETGYAVERSLTGTDGWSLVTTTAANTVSYTDTGLSQNTHYFYRVRAINNNSASYYINDDEHTLPSNGICGTSVADNCYLYSNAPINTQLSTPGGKNIVLVYVNGSSGSKIWKENGGSRILMASGIDQWTKLLNPDGKSQSAIEYTDPNLGTLTTGIAGRACPPNVYVDDSHMTTVGNCLYYSAEFPTQRLDATQNDGTTNQTTLGSYRLGFWNTAAGGNGIGSSWYEGNIQTCAAVGMRLPTLYEMVSPVYYLTNSPTDASPSNESSNHMVPPGSSGCYWTATASRFNSNYYFAICNPSSLMETPSNTSNKVRCVLP